MSDFTEMNDNWCRNVGGMKYRTGVSLRWEVATVGSGLWVEVPIGFEFDLSVPRAFRWLVSPYDPKYLPAACLHDFILLDGWDRIRAAAEFDLALRAKGVGRAKRLLMFLGVSIYKWW